jgi:adenylate cyclase
LRDAIVTDANFALAHALLALLSAFGANLSLVPNLSAAKVQAREEAERAVAIDPNAPDVLGFAGCAFADIGERERGMELLRRALELDPSNAQAHVALGAAWQTLRRGYRSMQFGMRSSPGLSADLLEHDPRSRSVALVASSWRPGRFPA